MIFDNGIPTNISAASPGGSDTMRVRWTPELGDTNEIVCFGIRVRHYDNNLMNRLFFSAKVAFYKSRFFKFMSWWMRQTGELKLKNVSLAHASMALATTGIGSTFASKQVLCYCAMISQIFCSKTIPSVHTYNLFKLVKRTIQVWVGQGFRTKLGIAVCNKHWWTVKIVRFGDCCSVGQRWLFRNKIWMIFRKYVPMCLTVQKFSSLALSTFAITFYTFQSPCPTIQRTRNEHLYQVEWQNPMYLTQNA